VRVRPLDLAVLAAVAACLLAFAFVELRGSGRSSSRGSVLADPLRTPGVTNPAVTQATIRSTICVHGWTATVRPPASYTSALKVQQMRAYDETGSPAAYQEDHLISLEVGGNPTDPRNLWPEPYPRAAQVDQIENQLNAAICSGKLTLAQAQLEESTLKHERG
jgi:hypothetical protein